MQRQDQKNPDENRCLKSALYSHEEKIKTQKKEYALKHKKRSWRTKKRESNREDKRKTWHVPNDGFAVFAREAFRRDDLLRVCAIN